MHGFVWMLYILFFLIVINKDLLCIITFKMAEGNHVNNTGNERKRTATFKKIREGIKKWSGEVTSRDQVCACYRFLQIYIYISK